MGKRAFVRRRLAAGALALGIAAAGVMAAVPVNCQAQARQMSGSVSDICHVRGTTIVRQGDGEGHDIDTDEVHDNCQAPRPVKFQSCKRMRRHFSKGGGKVYLNAPSPVPAIRHPISPNAPSGTETTFK